MIRMFPKSNSQGFTNAVCYHYPAFLNLYMTCKFVDFKIQMIASGVISPVCLFSTKTIASEALLCLQFDLMNGEGIREGGMVH